MTPSLAGPIQMRLPLTFRVFGGIVALLTVAIGLAVVGRAFALGEAGFATFESVLLAAVLTLQYRLLTLSVVSRGDELVVHNLTRTHRVRRDEIEQVGSIEIPFAPMSRKEVAVLKLRDGRALQVRVTHRDTWRDSQRTRFESDVSALRAFAATEPASG